MDLTPNKRLLTFYNFMKKIGLFNSQSDLAEQITSKNGKPVSQSFVSAMFTNLSGVPDSVIDQLEENFPFLVPGFLKGDQDTMISLAPFLRFLIARIGITQKEFVKRMKDGSIDEPFLSKMDEYTEPRYWDAVFEFVNEQLGTNISTSKIKNFDAPEPEFKGKSEMVGRLFELIDELKKRGEIETDSDFCVQIGIGRNLLANMKGKVTKQDVTKNIIVSVMKKYRYVNPDWFILGEGAMFRISQKSDNAQLLQEVLNRLRRIESAIHKEDSILS